MLKTISLILLISLTASPAGFGQVPAPAEGLSSVDLTRRALASNAQLAAARLEIDRARARLRQAGLRPNPSVEFTQQNGVLNSPGERGATIGFSLPLELAGQRGRRIDLARAEL